MKRFQAYDPKEYLDWQPDPEVTRSYRRRVDDDPTLRAECDALGLEGYRRIYQALVRTRLYDVTLKRWVRTGVLTKAWLGTGEEATTVGAVHALAGADVVGPMIRNQGACFEKGIPLADCFKVYLATGDTITRGRDLHIGDLQHNVVAPISHVGDLVPVLAGFALAFHVRRESRVALTWCGEGATRTGAFHEGLSFAADLGLPLVVVVQNNGVALGTRCGDTLARALDGLPGGYGVTGRVCDGNHVLEVYSTIREARALCVRGQGPVVVQARTFRMGGHATHDEAEARELFDAEVFRHWGARCPVGCFEEFLASEPVMGPDPRGRLAQWEAEVNDEVEAAAAAALAARETSPVDPGAMANDVFASA
ncbi:MAG: thiamine pyrophosphate-dependent dehydrogenase E1 component subunit alpha [Planctomycetota bacterium]